MIEIKVNDSYDRRRIDVSGHAGYADKGSDIICAAVSILMYTAVSMLSERDSGASELNYTLEEGQAHIEFTCEDGSSAEVIWDMLIRGLELLEDSYGQFISFV